MKRAVNDAGYIGGIGMINEQNHAFLLTPALTIDPPEPGRAGVVNTWNVRGAVPGSEVHAVYARDHGSATVPGCPGVRFRLLRPSLVASAIALDGTADVQRLVPANGRGQRILFQALESSTCRTSPVIVVTFE